MISMIDVKELRIGNKIIYKHKELTVAANTFGDIINDRLKGINEYCGIYLDHTWLVRFGFTRMSCPEAAYRFDDLVIEKESSLADEVQQWHWIYWIASGQIHRRVYLPYVHELQNVYFALTGQELTLEREILT